MRVDAHTLVHGGAGSPTVYLLDARNADMDESALKREARSFSALRGCCSRSYRYPFALVAVHNGLVGVDIERVTSWDPLALRSILTPGECDALGDASGDAVATSLWSSKEAVAKALGDPIRYDPRRIESPMFWPDGTAGRWRASILAVPKSHQAWLCWQAL
jgi:phosphopantetheinyl transferase